MNNSNIKDRCDCSPGYKKLKVHKNLEAIWNYLLYARLAQLGEHLAYNQRAGGSSPSLRTNRNEAQEQHSDANGSELGRKPNSLRALAQ